MKNENRPTRFWILVIYLALLSITSISPCQAQLRLGGSEWQVAGGGIYYTGNGPTMVNGSGWGASIGGSFATPESHILGQRWLYGGPGQELVGNQRNGSYQFLWFADMDEFARVVGYYSAYDSAGNSTGTRAGWWGANSQVVELGSTNTSNNFFFDAAFAINNAGTIVGSSDDGLGNRFAVKWTSQNTAPIVLGNLGVDTTGSSYSSAWDINQAGAIAGYSFKTDTSGNYLGQKAVRWDAGQVNPTELATVQVNGGAARMEGLLINNANQVAGYAAAESGTFHNQVVRWAADGSAQSMDHLSVSISGEFSAGVTAMNDRGTLVGSAIKFDSSGNNLGARAVRWNANTTAIEELQHLSGYGVNANGQTYSQASSVNQAGLAVGYVDKYDSNGDWAGSVGALWLNDGTFLDANWLNPIPREGGNGTWDIQRLDRIAANGWIGGYGIYTKNGVDYARAFVTQIGLGGIWVNPGLGAARLWGDGDNWDSGTPALQHGSARFAAPGTYDITVDTDTTTNFIEVDNGQLRLRLHQFRLNSREGMWIGPDAEVSLSTEFDIPTRLGGLFEGGIFNQGLLSAGQSPGLLAIKGDLFNEGELLFELGGSGIGEFDQIWLTRHFVAGGLLKVVLTDDFVPLVGDEFKLMWFGSIEKQGLQFDFSQASLPAGWHWNTSQFARSGILLVRGIPEPSTTVTLALGMLLIFSNCRRRR